MRKWPTALVLGLTSTVTAASTIVLETETVYDLQGRRVLRVKTPGFYLINGQKRFVRP